MAIQPSWSLTVEECFYILAPFIIIFIKRFGIAVPFFISVVLYIILLFTYDAGSPVTVNGFLISIGSFFGRFFEFYTGIFLAGIVRRKEKENYQRTGKQSLTFSAMIIILVLFIPLIYVINKNLVFKYGVMLIVNNILLPIPVAMLYFGLIFENTFFNKLLSLKFSRLCGRSSYSFYLLHVPVISFSVVYLKKYFAQNSNAYVMIVFMITLILSILLFLFYEQPMNKFIKKIFKKHHLKKSAVS